MVESGTPVVTVKWAICAISWMFSGTGREVNKKSEVKIGGIYSNGKGRIRKVVDIGPQYKLYDEQECLENLRYEIVHDGSKNNRTAGEQGNMTVASFAAWAKERI